MGQGVFLCILWKLTDEMIKDYIEKHRSRKDDDNFVVE
jgi:hypothetical protein